MKRKRSRKHDNGNAVVCRCNAYAFPHRMFAGRCSLLTFVHGFYFVGRQECRECMCYGVPECDVITGQEPALHCPELRDFVRFEGITLFGRARAQLDRVQRR